MLLIIGAGEFRSEVRSKADEDGEVTSICTFWVHCSLMVRHGGHTGRVARNSDAGF